MRKLVLLILGVCLLTSISSPGFSETPLRLFFEKNIPSQNKANLEEHEVQADEWLYKILTNKGYSHAEIQALMPAILEHNPHIPDINHLKAGQLLILPKQDLGKKHTPPPPKPVVAPAKTLEHNAEHRSYVVQEGDSLGSIFLQHNISSNVAFGKGFELVQQLNPEISDINQIKAGQEILLPVFSDQDVVNATTTGTTSKTIAQNTTTENISAVATTQDNSTQDGSALYTSALHGVVPVGIGASLGAIGIPQNLVQWGTLASGGGGVPSMSSAPTKPLSNVDIIRAMLEHTRLTDTPSSTSHPPRAGLALVRTVLEQMRFVFMPGDEVMYPLPRADWLHIKLQETPLIETPWGSKIILSATPKNSQWIEDAKTLNIHVCSMEGAWSLTEIFNQLSIKFPKNFRLWSQDKELVLARNGLNFSLKAPQIAIVEQGQHKYIYVVWARRVSEEPPLPQGLPEVLEASQVKIIELDCQNELSRLPARPSGSIVVSLASVSELMRVLDSEDTQELLEEEPKSLHGFLELLKSKDRLRQSMIRAAWVRGGQRLIAVQVPAWTISSGQNTIALLDRRFTDEHLLSLFAHQGYECFILPE